MAANPWIMGKRHGHDRECSAHTVPVLLLRSRLRSHMDYCMEHPEEISKIAAVQKKVRHLLRTSTACAPHGSVVRPVALLDAASSIPAVCTQSVVSVLALTLRVVYNDS